MTEKPAQPEPGAFECCRFLKIISFWRDNITPDKSNEFTAELLQKEFPEVSHRTLARYVSEAKKLPPDVKPGECPFYESQ